MSATDERRSGRRVNLLAGALALLLAAAAVIGVIAVTQSSHSGSGSSSATTSTPRAAAPGRIFAADSVWNRQIAAAAAPASDSSALVGELIDQLRADGAWIDTYKYSSPVYTVPGEQARVPVTLDKTGPSATALAAAFRAGVPIPSDAAPAPGTDEHMVVLQPSTNTMWEFWHMHRVDGRWHASWGGKMTGVSHNPGYFTDPPDWGATATSLPLLAGMMRVAELRAGRIDHALAIAIPHAAAAHVLPAQRSDGSAEGTDAIPEGTRFRIEPGVDLDALGLPRMTLMMARAVQRYGMIVRDQSGAVTFYGQQPTGSEPNPYEGAAGLFGGKDPAELLRSFPWHDLEVVDDR